MVSQYSEVTVFFVSFSQYTVSKKANPLGINCKQTKPKFGSKYEQKGMSDSVTLTLGQAII